MKDDNDWGSILNIIHLEMYKTRSIAAFSLPSLANLANITAATLAAAAIATSTTTISSIPAIAAVKAPPPTLGVHADLLKECAPPRVACTSSQDDAPASFLEPWQYDRTTTSVPELRERLVELLLSDGGARVVARQERYVRVEISVWGGAVDDVELFFPVDDDVVHFRSEARGARFDLFRNRFRMGSLRVRAGLDPVPVLRGRSSVLGVFESPFDSFGPSVINPDAIIDSAGVGSRPMR